MKLFGCSSALVRLIEGMLPVPDSRPIGKLIREFGWWLILLFKLAHEIADRVNVIQTFLQSIGLTEVDDVFSSRVSCSLVDILRLIGHLALVFAGNALFLQVFRCSLNFLSVD